MIGLILLTKFFWQNSLWMSDDTRWQQRFGNYEKALASLREGLQKEGTFSDLEKNGVIQRFEFTYELAWKTLQDLLIEKGYDDVRGPNPVIQQAFEDGYLEDADIWRKMKTDRQKTVHTYNEETSNAIFDDIKNHYLMIFDKLYRTLQKEIRKT